jgi:hypothetical protein
MMWKILAVIWFLLAMSVVVVWFAHGKHTFTKDKVQVVTKRVNPTFGVREEIVEWKPQFRMGLEYGVPAFVLFCGISFACWQVGKQRSP